MYTDVDFTSPGAPGPVVPEVAVQSIGERRYVFLPVKESDGRFTLREVRLGSAAGGDFSGLEGFEVQGEVVYHDTFLPETGAAPPHPAPPLKPALRCPPPP